MDNYKAVDINSDDVSFFDVVLIDDMRIYEMKLVVETIIKNNMDNIDCDFIRKFNACNNIKSCIDFDKLKKTSLFYLLELIYENLKDCSVYNELKCLKKENNKYLCETSGFKIKYKNTYIFFETDTYSNVDFLDDIIDLFETAIKY